MKIINCIQGDDVWHATRARHPTASEASVAMGASKKCSRTELLRIKATGDEREISEWVQKNLFDKGHEIEAATRPIAEKIIGAELYPITATDDDDYLLASFDGITLMADVGWEGKSWNEEKAAAVRMGKVPDEDYWQVVQQLAVSGAKRWLYTVGDGTEEGTVHCWMEPDPGQIEHLLACWRQFHDDLLNYRHVEAVVIPEGRAPETLPALRIEVTGMVTASNLTEFRATAMAAIGSVNTDLQTDQDFANAEKAVKWCGDVETRIDAAKQHALSQTTTIEELFRTMDDIKAEARAKRLDLEKLVKNRKESIRAEIQRGAVDRLREHYAHISAIFPRVVLSMPADFGANVAAAMKGKKTVASLRDAADTTLAHAKIKASQDADRVRANLRILDAHEEHAHLFPDFPTLVVTKAPDDFKAITVARIAEHKAAEEKRLEAERARIRAEEQKKLDDERKAQEAAAKPAQTAPAAITPASTGQAPTQAPAQVIARTPAPVPKKAGRPSDEDIIEVLAMHFGVHHTTVVAWLLAMDFDAERRKVAL